MVDVSWRGRVAVIELNRPEARNALSLELLAALQTRLGEVGEARCVVVRGSGGAFSAGADLRERQTMSAQQRTLHTRRIAGLCDQLEALPMPVAAAVEGYCLAGGLELALACDARFASDTAVFGFPEVQLGIFPGADGPLRLTRLLGPGRAARLLYSGARVGALEAVAMGLADSGDALVWADQVAANSPAAVRALKAGLRAARDLPFAQAQAVLRQFREPLDDSADYTAALARFKSTLGVTLDAE